MRTIAGITAALLLVSGCVEPAAPKSPRATSSPTLSGESATDADADHANAYDICKDFVKRRLKSPGSARFPDYFDLDGEVIVRRDADVYTVTSHVDSQNSFGALLSTPFVCQIKDEGDTWRLVDVTLLE